MNNEENKTELTNEENENKKQNKEKSKNSVYYIIAISVLLIAIIVVAVFMLNSNKEEKKDENVIAYTELIKQIDEGIVEEVEMTVGSTSIKVKLKDMALFHFIK